MRAALLPLLCLLCLLASAAEAAELNAGVASVSITPDRPVPLAGQMHTRIAKAVRSPVTATALALESKDAAILVSCDLVAIDPAVLARVRELVKARIPGFDGRKLVISATHTHTAPVQ